MAVLPDRVNGKLPKYTSLGCYPLFYVTKKGDVLCADCASEALDGTPCEPCGIEPDGDCPDCRGNGTVNSEDPPVGYDVNWENSVLSCESCGELIECAYIDPKAT